MRNLYIVFGTTEHFHKKSSFVFANRNFHVVCWSTEMFMLEAFFAEGKCTLCIHMDKLCSAGSEISTDDRSYLMHLINAMDVYSSNVFFYPRLLPFVSYCFLQNMVFVCGSCIAYCSMRAWHSSQCNESIKQI